MRMLNCNVSHILKLLPGLTTAQKLIHVDASSDMLVLPFKKHLKLQVNASNQPILKFCMTDKIGNSFK